MLHRWSLSYIIVQPEFSVLVGMRNRLCHELRLCHCNPESDISHRVNEDHMAVTGYHLKSSLSCLHVPVALHPGRTCSSLPPLLFLLPTLAEVKPSCSTWVTPFIPIACLVMEDGARRDVLCRFI